VLTKTLGELKKSKVHSLWTWSKAVYRGSAWGYGVVNAYTHPWVVKVPLRLSVTRPTWCTPPALLVITDQMAQICVAHHSGAKPQKDQMCPDKIIVQNSRSLFLGNRCGLGCFHVKTPVARLTLFV
jgi:hypothetical protein